VILLAAYQKALITYDLGQPSRLRASQRLLSEVTPVPSGGVTETTRSGTLETHRVLLSKLPAVTVWFWIIKISCTTVGESFADRINITLGVGLHTTHRHPRRRH
jgi:hypothetical protein